MDAEVEHQKRYPYCQQALDAKYHTGISALVLADSRFLATTGLSGYTESGELMPGARTAGSDVRFFSQVGLRMYREGRFVEYQDARRELAQQGIRARALRKRMDELYPPLTEKEIAARRATGQAPSEEEVALLVGRQQATRSRGAKYLTDNRGNGKPGASVGGGMRQYKRSAFTSPQQQVSALKEVEWVKNNLAVEGVKPKDAPSPGAWAMLESYRRTPAATQIFFEKIYAAVLPRRQEIENQERFRDDGRKLDDMADGVAKMAQLAVERAKEQWERLEAQARGGQTAARPKQPVQGSP